MTTKDRPFGRGFDDVRPKVMVRKRDAAPTRRRGDGEDAWSDR